MNGLRRFVPLLAVGALLAAAAVAASLSTPQITTVPVLRGRGSPPLASGRATPDTRVPSNPPGKVQHDFVLPGWLTTLVSAICIALVVAVVGAVLWLALRDRVRGPRTRARADIGVPA